MVYYCFNHIRSKHTNKKQKSRFKEPQYKSKVGIYGDLGDGLLLF